MPGLFVPTADDSSRTALIRATLLTLVLLMLLLVPAALAVNPPLYRDAVTDGGATVYYRLNEATGATTAVDATGHHNGTYASATLGVPGALNDQTTAADAPTAAASFTDANEHTLEFWALGGTGGQPGAGSSRTWIRHGLANSTGGWELYESRQLIGSASIHFNLKTPQGTFSLCHSPTEDGTNGWHYYVITWSATDVVCYDNGAEASHQTSMSAIDTSVSAAASQFAITAPGRLDEVALYPTALSAATIASHYNSAVVPYVTSSPTLTDTTVAGRHRTGDTESTTNGIWSGPFGDGSNLAYSYSWQRCTWYVSPTSNYGCSSIAGATGQTYTLADADIGSFVRSVVTATNAYGTVSAPSTVTSRVSAIPPSVATLPTIVPETTVQEGEVLDSNVGTWNGTAPITYSYQWKICTSPTDAATCSNPPSSNTTGALDHYWIGTYDVGKYVRLAVTARNSAASVTQLTVATAQVAAGDGCETLEGCDIITPNAPGGDIDPNQEADRIFHLAGAVAAGTPLPATELRQVGGTGSALVAAGRVTDLAGNAAVGQVAVFIIPSSDGSPQTYIPIGQVDLAPDGGYAISTPLTDAVRTEANKLGGALNLELDIFTTEKTYSVHFIRFLAIDAGHFEMTGPEGKKASMSTVALGDPRTTTLDPPLDYVLDTWQRVGPGGGCPGGPSNCTYSAWSCQDDGAYDQPRTPYSRLTELHTGGNFKGYINYMKGGGSASGSGSWFQVGVSDSGVDGGFGAGGETMLEKSYGAGGSTHDNPLPRNQNVYMLGRFKMGRQPTYCVRSVFYHGQFIGRRYAHRYRTKMVDWDDDLKTGGDPGTQWSKETCANSKYVTKWGTRKKGDGTDFYHEATNSEYHDYGFTLFGQSWYQKQFFTEQVTTGILLQTSDSAPYIVCGWDDVWKKAVRFFAGS